jgi:hypothetical protein
MVIIANLNHIIMKTAKQLPTSILSIFALGLCCFACSDNIPPPANDPANVTSGIEFIHDGNKVHVVTPDNSLMLTFSNEDFIQYQSEFNLKSNLKIESYDFQCQKDQYFSNKIWVIKPHDIIFEHPVCLTIYYTHEEFAPDFHTNGLRIYQLNREYRERTGNNKDLPLIRVSDMSIVSDCLQNDDVMMVTTDIQILGAYVLGRVIK